MAIVASIAIPVSLAGLERSRGWSAARFVASRLVQARALAVGRGAAVAIRFDGDGLSTTLSQFVDGNHNGVLTRDIDAGIDIGIETAIPLAGLFPGMTMQFDQGAPRLFSFSPDGTATTGSLYLSARDGSRFAVRVLGATARVRVERYVPSRDSWVEAF
jgi:Tfp pilus assembly protein FimT